MGITFDPRANQISSMRSFRFAASEEKTASTAGQTQDQIQISQAGRQAVAEAEGDPGLAQLWEKLEANLSGMIREDFQASVREQLGEQKLEVNWNAAVDPDGQIWCKAYFDSWVSQATAFREKAESAIKDYYAGAYQEAQNSENPLSFLSSKYLCSWTDVFAAGMPAAERQWTYNQVQALLTGGRVRLDDPYALKGIDIPTIEDTVRIAKQAADDRISELVRQAKEAEGITD